ncbi:hypothetical protein CQ017_14005 [Arthrobacter sp. MYb224]|nr:hypothetical protein CQ017_14005 [Arthrobacter sp. MYb224]
MWALNTPLHFCAAGFRSSRIPVPAFANTAVHQAPMLLRSCGFELYWASYYLVRECFFTDFALLPAVSVKKIKVHLEHQDRVEP